MRGIHERLGKVGAAALLLAFAASGCVTAAAAGAGAVAGIEYTNRGAKGDIKGSVDDVAKRTEKVFRQQGIALTESKVEKSGAERVLAGKQGDLDVKVTISPSPGFRSGGCWASRR